jgi:hypothetical protein
MVSFLHSVRAGRFDWKRDPYSFQCKAPTFSIHHSAEFTLPYVRSHFLKRGEVG